LYALALLLASVEYALRQSWLAGLGGWEMIEKEPGLVPSGGVSILVL
jgi:hypothetical protein